MNNHEKNHSQARAPLFRSQVLAEKRDKWLGPILLDASLLPLRLLLGLMLVVLISLTYIGLLDYTRKTTVHGLLVPKGGLVRIYSPIVGVTTQINVQEGQHVNKGDALLSVSVQHANASGIMHSDTIKQNIKARYQIELKDKRLLNSQKERQIRNAEEQVAVLEKQRRAIDQEISIVQRQIAANEKSLSEQKNNYVSRLTTADLVDYAEKEYLSSLATLQRLRQSASTLELDFNAAKNALLDLPLQYEADLAELNKRLLDLQQQMSEHNARSSVVIIAPESGIISSLQASQSSATPVNVPILTMIPDNTRLVAHLYGTSQSVGLIKVSDPVNIRYEAFPYQRFGFFNGQVAAVSKAALGAAELPPQLATFANENANQSLYRILVTLDKDFVVNGEDVIPLQAGLRLEADISLETMQVYQWISKSVSTSL